MAIINGRKIKVPDSGIYGSELIKKAGNKNGRRVVVRNRGVQFEKVKSNKLYSKEELINKKGQPVKVTTIPDRTKAANFGGIRSSISKKIITEQVIDIAEHYFKSGVDFDEKNADWLVVPKYKLPKIWNGVASFSPLLIVFPTDYPEIPPIGFYLRADLPISPNGHLYNQAYHEACKDPLEEGWKWYCVYVHNGKWNPSRYINPGDWKYGDDLWTYVTLINEVLGSND